MGAKVSRASDVWRVLVVALAGALSIALYGPLWIVTVAGAPPGLQAAPEPLPGCIAIRRRAA